MSPQTTAPIVVSLGSLDWDWTDNIKILDSNLNRELKLSVIESLQLLSDTGVLHGNLELLNIVQSAENPEKAKIIYFGRAQISEDRVGLRQAEALKRMLKTSSVTAQRELDEN